MLAYRCIKDHFDGKQYYYCSELVWFSKKEAKKLKDKFWERKKDWDRK